jgi:hypothetical protein
MSTRAILITIVEADVRNRFRDADLCVVKTQCICDENTKLRVMDVSATSKVLQYASWIAIDQIRSS